MSICLKCGYLAGWFGCFPEPYMSCPKCGYEIKISDYLKKTKESKRKFKENMDKLYELRKSHKRGVQ